MLVFVLDSRIKYDYVTWFEKKYFPADSVSPYWQQRDLCYQLSAEVGNNELEGDRYQGGRMSWYSMDYKATKKKEFQKRLNGMLCHFLHWLVLLLPLIGGCGKLRIAKSLWGIACSNNPVVILP